MIINIHNKFIDILTNRNHIYGSEHGHVVLVGPERNLSDLVMSCYNSEQSLIDVITARLALTADIPGAVFGTMLRQLLNVVSGLPNNIDDYQRAILQDSGSSVYGWIRFVDLANQIKSSWPNDLLSPVAVGWIVGSSIMRNSEEYRIESPYNSSNENSISILSSGKRVVLFLEIYGNVDYDQEWINWLLRIVQILPYRSMIVISGLYGLGVDDISEYIHQVELESDSKDDSSAAHKDTTLAVKRVASYSGISALNDNTEVSDSLGRNIYADAIASLLAHNETEPPLTIGIHGPWGMGKTHFMHRIASKLDSYENPNFLIVKFNAWRYNDDRQVWAGLLNSVSQAIENKIGIKERLLWRIKLYWKESKPEILLSSAVIIVASVFMSTTFLLMSSFSGAISGIALASVYYIIRNIQKVHLLSTKISKAAKLPRHDSELGFQNIVMNEMHEMQAVLMRRKPSCRSVVFIDDLDRCSDDRIIETLQAIILVLAESDVFVILGIDTAIIQQAIMRRGSSSIMNNIHADESALRYLRKIIQLSFSLPKIDNRKHDVFIQSMFSNDSVFALNNMSDIASYSDNQSDINIARDLMLSYNKSLILDLPSEHTPHYIDIATRDTRSEIQAFLDYGHCIENNPREIKRIINIHRLMKLLLQSRGTPDGGWTEKRQIQLVRWVLFCVGWHNYASDLMNDRLHISTDEDVIDIIIKQPSANATDPEFKSRLDRLHSSIGGGVITYSDFDDVLQFVYDATALLQ